MMKWMVVERERERSVVRGRELHGGREGSGEMVVQGRWIGEMVGGGQRDCDGESERRWWWQCEVRRGCECWSDEC